MSGKRRPKRTASERPSNKAANARGPRPEYHPRVHRLAWVLCVMVVGLLWVGGTVTTYDAGMAVEDWPTTYGHWFYPLGRWLGGVWDLFLEHGHRLLAQTVGLLSIVLAVLIFRGEPRRSVRWLGAAVLAGVVLQGVLGGLRVWFDQKLLALVHACFAPVFLCLCGALVAVTSRRWIEAEEAQGAAQVRRISRLSRLVVVFCYVEIILGALLRHPGSEGWPRWFELLVWLKLLGAGLIGLGTVGLAMLARRAAARVAMGGHRPEKRAAAHPPAGAHGPQRRAADRPLLARRAWLLLGAVGAQLVLAAATWVTNYGWPAWFRAWFFTPAYTVVREGRWQVNVTTAHATLGALCLLAAVNLALWSGRLLRGPVR